MAAIIMLVAVAHHSVPLKVFFGIAFVLLITAAVYLIRNRKKFFGYHGDSGDTYASANLRMWMVILILIHAVVITFIMIFEV